MLFGYSYNVRRNLALVKKMLFWYYLWTYPCKNFVESLLALTPYVFLSKWWSGWSWSVRWTGTGTCCLRGVGGLTGSKLQAGPCFLLPSPWLVEAYRCRFVSSHPIGGSSSATLATSWLVPIQREAPPSSVPSEGKFSGSKSF